MTKNRRIRTLGIEVASFFKERKKDITESPTRKGNVIK